ncbi:NADPH-dependent 7-cyano-7-deazaguanine reductase QueF [Colwellia sp. MB02u-18]|uniref:NADPH-dependent 7-cyano-7-deazaguanine reductase QueF n=1 Tax=unclassified Colwellia TaxID=196834 RepID=UPI0015F75516|nr:MULTISPECIES: NADPH-dependent 7-cyano-7-deazaguanine reductase QueF [unclassified Colwellia]MBA6225148.1 NADPH-dependent 7-cyano-7-deazaguanine reductase QueF [Colwellia sp. MB3u-45]MBA6268564.1 NADPH-dependent 7-cyano-7-deazaguanine reductase QueF [Colwellia sp. MB3u-43]MBA6320995.1 NADPH-dependent 7-cyano-7-deazaguanine reductase QueF [Colwellia sp. MB02u-19]MBA6325548.1 NADPH-dependent 7-cyano-7-deazaguanine reductase QueF [Colwellia sp. MB02u-18]MBA6332023.1 NADPH-dependent 7-cyano-7-de
MSTYTNAKALSKLTLGKVTSYCSQYTPELLQAVPRSLNRDSLGLTTNKLPFKGEDVWYGYELSWLNDKGKPVVAVAEFSFPCTSPNIVESKSFKLYLNSFNQTRFSSWQSVESALIKDLSATAGASAEVKLFPVNNCPALAIALDNALCIDELDIEVSHYQLAPQILKSINHDQADVVTEYLVCHLLKSNCLITNQPDWASVYIEYSGQQICHETLLKYLISFRQHNEFHEQCVERIFCDLKRFCQIEHLTVFARYTRRGGLDINPFRSTSKTKAPKLRTLRQ